MNKFLIKLKTQKKLEVIEKSEEVCQAYLLKSENCLKSSKILLKEAIYENAIIDSYYAMYNCVLALFFKCGIKCENHYGSSFVLKETFNVPHLSVMLKKAKKSRIDSQYYISGNRDVGSEANISKGSAEEAIKISEDFILQLKAFMHNLKNLDMDRIRKDLSVEDK